VSAARPCDRSSLDAVGIAVLLADFDYIMNCSRIFHEGAAKADPKSVRQKSDLRRHAGSFAVQ